MDDHSSENGGLGLSARLPRRSLLKLGVGLSQAMLLAGCGILPRSGPATGSIASGATVSIPNQSDSPVFSYVLLDIDNIAVELFGTPPANSLYDTFGADRGPAPNIIVGVGDNVQVTIFESQSGGLFIPAEASVRPGNFVTLPPQTIDRRGNISVPYAGEVPALGKTIPQLQRAIQDSLSKRAIEPQAIVSIINRASSQATVVGAVNAPNKVEINIGGDRILDTIAKAGGINAPGYEIYVTLERDNRKATVYFPNILANARDNVFVHPGDTIYVYREPQRYSAYGAVRQPGLIDFGAPEINLADAVAKVAGLDDVRAEPRDLFLYRLVPRKLVERRGAQLGSFPQDTNLIPVIFRANFRDPASYFAAMHFKLANRDVIYISDSAAYELYKFLLLLNNLSQTAVNITEAASYPKYYGLVK